MINISREENPPLAKAKCLVQHGYDQVAPAYLSKFTPRSIPTRAVYTEKLAKLPQGAKVLEWAVALACPTPRLSCAWSGGNRRGHICCSNQASRSTSPASNIDPSIDFRRVSFFATGSSVMCWFVLVSAFGIRRYGGIIASSSFCSNFSLSIDGVRHLLAIRDCIRCLTQIYYSHSFYIRRGLLKINSHILLQ